MIWVLDNRIPNHPIITKEEDYEREDNEHNKEI